MTKRHRLIAEGGQLRVPTHRPGTTFREKLKSGSKVSIFLDSSALTWLEHPAPAALFNDKWYVEHIRKTNDTILQRFGYEIGAQVSMAYVIEVLSKYTGIPSLITDTVLNEWAHVKREGNTPYHLQHLRYDVIQPTEIPQGMSRSEADNEFKKTLDRNWAQNIMRRQIISMAGANDTHVRFENTDYPKKEELTQAAAKYFGIGIWLETFKHLKDENGELFAKMRDEQTRLRKMLKNRGEESFIAYAKAHPDEVNIFITEDRRDMEYIIREVGDDKMVIVMNLAAFFKYIAACGLGAFKPGITPKKILDAIKPSGMDKVHDNACEPCELKTKLISPISFGAILLMGYAMYGNSQDASR